MKPPSTREELAAALAEVPLFRGLSMASVGTIAHSTRGIKARNGESIYRQGLRPRAFYHVLSGQVKVSISSDAGDEKVLEIYSSGQSFGVSELFGSQPFLSSAQATVDSLLLAVDRDGLAVAMEREAQLAGRVLTHLADRKSVLERDIASYFFHSGCRRLVNFLLRQEGESADSTIVHLTMSKRLLAARLGLTPESLSRAFKELSSSGLIVMRGRSITLQEALLARQSQAADGGECREPGSFLERRRRDPALDHPQTSAPLGSRAWL